MFQHLPDGWITPVVGHLLREDIDLKVIMATRENSWAREDLIDIQANHVLSCFLHCIIKSLLVLLGFAFPISHAAISIAKEDKHTT